MKAIKISKLVISTLVCCSALLGCTAPGHSTGALDDHQRIAQETIIIDTHIDVPYRVFRNPDDVSAATEGGEFDYPRARAGGLNAPFMSIYIPADVDEAGDAFDFAEQSIASVEDIVKTNPDKFALATCTQDIQDQFAAGLISLPLGMENGGPIEGKVSNLEHFFERGIRYITLTHSKSNHISDSSYDTNERWNGLSEFGTSVIADMNRLGVMVDVSHISDKAFWQVMELSAVPVLATHSSMRHFTPEFQRNMSDDMVSAMAARGGVIQINFGSSFLHKAARDYGNTRTSSVREYQMANHIPDNDPRLMAYYQEYSAANPYPYADLDVVLDHIDRAVEVAGIDAVGIGSDYDGVGDSLPVGLKDVASYPNLIKGLLGRGYSETDIAKVLGGNTLRVWQAVEDYAANQGTARRCAS